MINKFGMKMRKGNVLEFDHKSLSYIQMKHYHDIINMKGSMVFYKTTQANINIENI